MSGSGPRRDDLDAVLRRIEAEADAGGVALEIADLGTCVWISEIHRSPAAPPGAGRAWIGRVRQAAAGQGLPVELGCTSWNSQLVAYYMAQGFETVATEGDDIFLRAPMPAPS